MINVTGRHKFINARCSKCCLLKDPTVAIECHLLPARISAVAAAETLLGETLYLYSPFKRTSSCNVNVFTPL